MVAIIREESGNLTSKLAKNNNNLTGMKLPRKRETTALYADKSGYSVFDSHADCVEDLAIYIDTYITPKGLSRIEASRYLEKNYAMSEGYSKRLLKLM